MAAPAILDLGYRKKGVYFIVFVVSFHNYLFSGQLTYNTYNISDIYRYGSHLGLRRHFDLFRVIFGFGTQAHLIRHTPKPL